MYGVVEKGWCWWALVCGGLGCDRLRLRDSGFRRHGWGTNVDILMLVGVVERVDGFVVGCGNGEYQLEIGGA